MNMNMNAEAASYRVNVAIAKIADLPHAKRVLIKLTHLRQNINASREARFDVGLRNYVDHLLCDPVVQSVLKSRLAH